MSLRDRFIHIRPKQAARLARVIVCAALAATLCAQNANTPADPATGERPASAGRVVRAFDFEEQDFNPLPVPLGWYRGQEAPDIPRLRPGFPIWNHAVLDYKSPAFAGVGSVKLPTKGGSTSLILRRGEINIFPNADYLVSVRIRTQGLTHAKARVIAKLIDQHGNEIQDAQSATELVNTNNQWEQVSLEIEGVYPAAAFVQIELQLLQPKQQHPERERASFEVWEQDYDGMAWFDNLIIAQLPRLEISTGIPGNIIESQAAPPLRILVRDLTGDAITARVRIFDVLGQEVDAKLFDDGNRRVRAQWTPELPGLGWYRATLEVVVDDQLVGLRALDFIWAPFNEPNHDSGMFAIHTKLTDPKIAQSARTLIKGIGVTSASVEAWNLNTTREDIALDSITMQAINELLSMGTELSIVLAQLPQELANTLAKDPSEVFPVFAGPSGAWIPWGSPMLDQYGQAVSKWRFGDRPTQESTATLNAQLDAINAALVGYVPGPTIVTPWSIDRPIEPAIVRPNQQLLIIENNTSTEEAMQIIVDDWARAAQSSDTPQTQSPSALGMVLAPMHDSRNWSGVQVWSSVGALARKAISFWWAARSSGIDPQRFDLELKDAWWISPGKRGQVMPAPELVVWRTLATHLGGREAIEEIDLIAGVRMLVAGPKPELNQTNETQGINASTTTDPTQSTENTGALVLWLDKPSIEPVILNLPLATSSVTQYDIFNNPTTIEIERTGSLDLPVHRIEITRSPIIIQGVNTNLIRFLGALKITPNTLQAKSGIHKHALTLSNPWPLTVRGQIYIVEPGGYTGPQEDIDRSWEIKPRVIPFVLDANQTREVPIDIAYSLGELAGEKQLAFDLELEADQDYPLMRIERTITLELEGITMNLTARRGADGITIIAVQVTNNLDSNQDFEVIAIPPNEPRLRRSINAIKPSETTTREFAFTKAQSGDQIIVSLMLRESSVRLNKAVTVP